jgi:hypothetical protein
LRADGIGLSVLGLPAKMRTVAGTAARTGVGRLSVISLDW